MIAQHVDHQTLAVVEKIIRNHHPVMGVAHVVAEVSRATSLHFVVQESVLLADQPLFGHTAKKGSQTGVRINAVVEVLKRLAHGCAVTQLGPEVRCRLWLLRSPGLPIGLLPGRAQLNRGSRGQVGQSWRWRPIGRQRQQQVQIEIFFLPVVDPPGRDPWLRGLGLCQRCDTQAILGTSGRQRVKLAIAVGCHQRIDRPLPVLARTPPVSSIIQGEPQGS